MLGSDDLLGESLLPLRARALEERDKRSLRLGDLPVQIGHFGYRFAQQWTTMITAAGMSKAGKRFFGWRQPAGNLTPDRPARTIAVAGRRLSRSNALHLAIELAIEQSQILKLLPADRTGGKMRVHIGCIRRGFRTPARLLEQLREFRRSDVLAGISFQN
jgi:hypothetical protein